MQSIAMQSIAMQSIAALSDSNAVYSNAVCSSSIPQQRWAALSSSTVRHSVAALRSIPQHYHHQQQQSAQLAQAARSTVRQRQRQHCAALCSTVRHCAALGSIVRHCAALSGSTWRVWIGSQIVTLAAESIAIARTLTKLMVSASAVQTCPIAVGALQELIVNMW